MSNTAKTVTLFSAVIVFGLLIGLLWPSPPPARHLHPHIDAMVVGPGLRGETKVYHMENGTKCYHNDDDGQWYWWLYTTDSPAGSQRTWTPSRVLTPYSVPSNRIVKEEEFTEEVGEAETEDKQEEMQESEPDQAEPSPEAAPATSSPAPEAPAEAAPAETGGTDSSSSDSGGGDGGGGGGCFR